MKKYKTKEMVAETTTEGEIRALCERLDRIIEALNQMEEYEEEAS